ncbi:MAG: hypothetical protein LBN28_01670 [Desulfovibrio sp.]|jgi:hypothetical protein|nr:hypothetical protein [Desulfovibrio sp.]
MRHCVWISALLGAFVLALSFTIAGAEQGEGINAKGFFALLPPSIFENTVEGLPETEKQRLLVDGQAEFWQVAYETDDVLVFSSLPFHDSTVVLRLFRNTADNSCIAAIGTTDRPLCTMELWRVDNSGRIVPIDAPTEPDIKEFLEPGQFLPDGINPSVLICLDTDGVRAQPLFWSSSGLADMSVANDIRYQWTGTTFEKQILPKSPVAPRYSISK